MYGVFLPINAVAVRKATKEEEAPIPTFNDDKDPTSDAILAETVHNIETVGLFTMAKDIEGRFVQALTNEQMYKAQKRPYLTSAYVIMVMVPWVTEILLFIFSGLMIRAKKVTTEETFVVRISALHIINLSRCMPLGSSLGVFSLSPRN